MKQLLATASAIALTALPHTGAAQDFDLGEIVVYSNLTETPAAQSGATTDVFTEDDLTASGTVAVATQLDNAAGVSVSRNGSYGASTNLRLRGLSGYYVGVRIDGIDISDPASTQSAFNWGALTTAGLSRVEVLKGSQSALYGSEAIAGVVNLTTARATEDGTHVSFGAEAGSYNTRSVTGTIKTKAERGELALTLSHFSTDGFSHAEENVGNTEADGHDSTTAILSGAYQATDSVRLGFSLLYQKSESDLDGFPAPAFTFADTADQEFAKRFGGRVFAEFETGAISHTLSLSGMKTEREYPTGFSRNFTGERMELDYRGVADLGTASLAFGATSSEEKFTIDALSADYRINSVFAEYQRALSDRTDISLSARHDDHSEFGGFTSGRAALAFRPTDGTVIRASLGNGFRAPSLYELFGPFGNAALQPEKSISADLGIEKTYDNGAKVSATIFYTEVDDLIQWAGVGYAQVPGTSKTQGIELAAEAPMSDNISLFGSFTYTDAKGRFGAKLLRVPTHDTVIGVNARIGARTNAQATIQHVSGLTDLAGAMPSYTVANATVTYDISDNTQAYVRVENLFDEEYQVLNGYGTSDRAAFFGVRADF